MSCIKSRYIITCFVLLNLSCISQLFSQTSLFSYEEYIGASGDTLRYRQLISDSDTLSKFPLVIFLHGAGERGNDNENQLKWGVMNFATNSVMKNYRPIVIAPQCPENMRWGNFSYEDSNRKNLKLETSPSRPMKLLIELINWALIELPVDPDRIYITGISMGGEGTFDAISRYPELFAAAVPVCGGGDVSRAQQFSKIPLWIFHGVKDSVVSPDRSINMLDALRKYGAYPGFTLYPEAGHFAWIAAYDDFMMMEWLFRQHK